MNYTLHVTNNCNFNCNYCYENKNEKEIDFEDIKVLIDREISNNSKYVGLTFYGGEPLLRKDLIYKIIDYINSKKSKTKFLYGITTNGSLLNEEIIKFFKNNKFSHVAYSFDGIKEAQDSNRIFKNGKGSFDIVEQNAKKLLKNNKNVVAMVVVTRNNIEILDKSVEYLIGLGFKIINLQFDYLYNWKDEELKIIKEQYSKVADIYYQKILEKKDVNIINFDSKINAYIKGEYDCNNECNLGLKNINVGADGNFYPCVQFVGDNKYIIGNCREGIDVNARNNLINRAGKENDTCKSCEVRKRCKHICACRNYILTKDINKLSPLTCELERITIEVADNLANKLYENNYKLFSKKYYNKNNLILSKLRGEY